MEKRILELLDYPGVEELNLKDENSFRTVVMWLETNKIKKSTQELLNDLKNTKSSSWNQSFDAYKQILGCPKVVEENDEVLFYLAQYAIQIEYKNNKEMYNNQFEDESKADVPNVTSENPLDSLDLNSVEFRQGIEKIAGILKISPHPNSSITLEAVKDVITKRLNPDALQNPEKYILRGTPYPLEYCDPKVELDDPVLKNASRILRMLYIQDLRDLQTKVNEVIVSMQNITADPKTDTRLGKVGF